MDKQELKRIGKISQMYRDSFVGITQATMAERLDRSNTTIYKFENGLINKPEAYVLLYAQQMEEEVKQEYLEKTLGRLGVL